MDAEEESIRLATLALPSTEFSYHKIEPITTLGDSSLSAVRFAPRKTTIFARNYDEGVLQFDAKTYSPISTWTWEGGKYEDDVLSADGSRLATVDDQFVVRTWDTKTGKVLAKYAGHPTRPNAIGISPDGAIVASSHMEPIEESELNYLIWDSSTGKQIWRKAAGARAPKPVDFSPDGKYVALWGDGAILLCDPRSGKELKKVRMHEDENVISFLKFSADSQMMAVAGKVSIEGQDKVYCAMFQVAQLKPVWVAIPGGEAFEDACFSPDGQWIAMMVGEKHHSQHCDIQVRQVANGKPLYAWRDRLLFRGPLSVSRDGKVLACNTGHGVVLWASTEMRPMPQ